MSHSLQTLEPEVVCQITEALMLTHGTTTSLDVKKELREQGFFAVQAEVSALMEVMAEERNWKFWSNGRYRVYTFAEDTKEQLYQYLKKGNETWEIMVDGHMQIIATGNPEKTVPIDYQEFPSNRHAFVHASGLLLIQESKGFVPTMPRGLSLKHRYRFREVIKQTPISVVLSLRDGALTETIPAQFSLHNQTAIGKLVHRKKAGYAFELSLEEARAALAHRAEDGSWMIPGFLLKKGFLLGEELVHTSAYLSSGEALGQWNLLRTDVENKKVQLCFPATGIYKAELNYQNGRTVELSYQNWSPATELWPLVCLLLGI